MFGLLRSLASCPSCRSSPPGASGLCGSCLQDLFQAVHHPGMIALGRYEGALASAVRALKFGGVTSLAVPLAQELTEQVMRRGWRPSAVSSVPLHASRSRERGYNQAELLARACASQLGVPWLELLSRPQRTAQQARLPTHRRARNTGSAFSRSGRAPRILPARVLLIDDVITTGATLEACRHELLAAGCEQVYVAVVAAARPRPATDAARREAGAADASLRRQT